MQAVHAFREAVQAWQQLIDRADQLDPESRLEAITAHLVHLYALGLRLPAAPPTQPPGEPAAWPEHWPGMGEADAEAPPVSLLLRGMSSDLSRAVDLDDTLAGAWWRRSFDARWGTLATASLGRLHAALVQTRRPIPDAPPETGPIETAAAPEPTTAQTTPIDATTDPTGPALLRHQGQTLLPGLEPAPPTRQRTARARLSAAGPPGVLGLRFEATPHGLSITAIHPSGPAKNKLEPGDLLMAIDGLPLRDRDTDALRAALVGAVGEPRQLLVGRGDGVIEVELCPVAPHTLGPPPLDVQLLVFDDQAFTSLVADLDGLGVALHPDPDQPGQIHLTGPPSAQTAMGPLLTAGEQAGWWARLD